MKIATLLFTYNRSIHTELVLDSLKRNTKQPKKLIIFQDGLREECGEDAFEWKKVNECIHSIDWCEKEVIVSDYNKGLAKSIVSGINYAFKEHDAVIVLEDDCVTAPDFIHFMEQCFEKYEKKKDVYSISGYSWPMRMEKKQYDVYGCGRISSWGWGTWKDRWQKYNTDNEIIKRIKKDPIKLRNLATWGNDCERMFLDKILGENDSWAIYWALIVIENEGVCINPYSSLINNIGMDGTGVHCGKTDKFQVELSDDIKIDFKLPDEITILDSTKKAFAGLHGNYTAANEHNGLKEKILVYGLGNFYFCHEKEINDKYYVVAFVDNKKKGWYAGKKIIHLHNIEQYSYDKIFIMIQNIQDCIIVIKELLSAKISLKRILLGHNYYGKYSSYLENISFFPDGKLAVATENLSLKIRSLEDFDKAYEILVEKIYQYFVNNKKNDIVLDIGMKNGNSTLYFINCEKVEKVYAYEPYADDYLEAKNNLCEYLPHADQIEIFQYGISSDNGKQIIRSECDTEEGKQEQIEFKDAFEEFAPIIHRHVDCNIILKIDSEGEEYSIINRLYCGGVLTGISFIMLHWYGTGKNHILSCLRHSGFSFWCIDKSENRGMIYAYK